MSLILPPFREERLQYSQSAGKSRVSSRYLSKLPYYFTIPEFSFSNTWRGASEIIKKYYYQFEKNFSILDFLSIVPDGDYILCVSWKLLDVFYRYSLWYDNLGLLYVPTYDGRTIYKNFYLEVWNTDVLGDVVGGGSNLKISQFAIPVLLCDSAEIDLAPSHSDCNDMVFDLTNFDPSNGDSYNVINTCLDTELV